MRRFKSRCDGLEPSYFSPAGKVSVTFYCPGISPGRIAHLAEHCSVNQPPLYSVVSLFMSRGRRRSMSESYSDSISILTWGTGQGIPRPIGTAGDDGQEIFRWSVMLRKGKLRLPHSGHGQNNTEDGSWATRHRDPGPNTQAACEREKLLLWLSVDTMPSVAREEHQESLYQR